MKRIVLLIAAAISLFAPPAHPQDINLGNYYQNLYFQTHVGPGGAPSAYGTRRRARRARPRVSAPARWTLNPKNAAIIKRLVASVPVTDRPAARKALEQALASYPKIVNAVRQSTGVPVRADDPRDAGAIAGTIAYQELSGKELTDAQFAANRALSHRLFGNGYLSRADMQENGETYAMAVCLMAVLKVYADNPQNKNPDLTRRQLRGLVQDTFRVGYRDADYTKFAPTSRGLVKVR